MMRFERTLVVAICAAISLGLFSSFVDAAGVAKPAEVQKAKKPARAPITGDAGAAKPAAAPRAKSDSRVQNASKDAGASVEVAKKDGGAQTFRFGELEIEGRLKSPQLVYFLRRVRAEFAADDLGHRTFIPELEQTPEEPSF